MFIGTVTSPAAASLTFGSNVSHTILLLGVPVELDGVNDAEDTSYRDTEVDNRNDAWIHSDS
jgi:hypothetical protein